MNRRTACKVFGISALTPRILKAAHHQKFKLRYVLNSAMYGEMLLKDILPEIKKTGSESIDIWPRVHGNQREQITKMGDEACMALLEKHDAR